MLPKPHAPRLSFHKLENRDLPSGYSVSNSFDSVPIGQIPTGWSSWNSDSSTTIGTTLGRSFSTAEGLTATGNSRSTVRTWTASAPADMQVSAAIYADSLSPAAVYLRGQNLNTATPSSYSATLTRGVVASITKTINGVDTVLATVKSKDYVSQKWIRVGMTAVGSSLTMTVERLDTNQWLTAAGTWSASSATALTATDSSITQGGGVGLARAAGTASPVTFDDFSAKEIVSITSTPPTTTPVPTTPSPTSGSLPATPVIASKLPNIRIAALAYSGNPMGAFEQSKLQTAVDLVIPDTRLMSAIDTASRSTPQMVYANVSNMYLDTLTSWLNYADASGNSRESAFYHVTAATPWQGGSPSSIPVTWFWSASQGPISGATKPSDQTSAVRGTGAKGLTFGDAGTAVSLGYPEKFRELNVTLSTPATGNYAGVWEYAAGIDASGVVNIWKTLPTLSNGTNGLKQTGQIAFDPPADWVSGVVSGTTQRLYSVRFRTTTGTTANAPVAKTILGRDYAGANGGQSGTIPAFDYSADKNGDGYLSDAEYANRKSGFNARFIYESRLFYPYYGQQRFVVDPSTIAVEKWAASYGKQLLGANPLADGLFLDNSNGKLPFSGVSVRESTANYTADSAALVGAVWKAVAPKLVVVNTVGSQGEGSVIAAQAPVAFEEFSLRPTTASWTTVEDIAALVKSRLAAASSPYVILDSYPGTTSVSDPRTQIGTLAYYYLVADPNKTMIMFDGGYQPNAPWKNAWITAAETDVGQPTAAMKIWATGNDPQNPALQYRVYSRAYGNALVLYKPRSYATGTTGTTDDATATTHQLGGSYRTLNADGTLGPVVTQVTLRGGEGAILMKV